MGALPGQNPQFGAQSSFTVHFFIPEVESVGCVNTRDCGLLDTVQRFGAEVDCSVLEFGAELDCSVLEFGAEVDSSVREFGAEVDCSVLKFGAELDSSVQEFGAELDSSVQEFGADTEATVRVLGADTKSFVQKLGANSGPWSIENSSELGGQELVYRDNNRQGLVYSGSSSSVKPLNINILWS